MQVPTKPSMNFPALNENYFLLMAPPKFGKSTWASEIGNNIFLDVDNNLKFLSVRKMPTYTWETFLEAISALERAPNLECDFIVVDTISGAYYNCFKYCCKKGGFDHPGDKVKTAAHGKGWDRIKTEWITAVRRLQGLEKGLIFIGHSQTKEVEVIEDGMKKTIDKESLQMPGVGASVVQALVDFTFIGTHEIMTRNVKDRKTGKTRTVRKTERVWRTKSEVFAEAGDRSNRLPDIIPFEASWLQANYGKE